MIIEKTIEMASAQIRGSFIFFGDFPLSEHIISGSRGSIPEVEKQCREIEYS